MFIDRLKLTIKAGNGGNGCTSFYTEKYVAKGGPDGGDGGNGGNFYIRAFGEKRSLYDIGQRNNYNAGDGENGTHKFCHGKKGADFVLDVPVGTVVKDYESGRIIADMFQPGAQIMVLAGGSGGKGNARFKTSRRQAPRFSQTGQRTEKHEILLELKTIADVGLVGYPNVGKSTLLSRITAARPKIADYHFTTLSPNLGVVKYYDQSFVIADIPGLIDGASEGIGLGHDFLRHIDRTRMLVHVVDIAAVEGRDPVEDYRHICKELKAYNRELAALPQIIALNKADLLPDEEAVKAFKQKVRKKTVLISAATGSGSDQLVRLIAETLSELPPLGPLEFEPFVYEAGDTRHFEIVRDDDGAFVVFGGMVDEMARNVVISDLDSMKYFQKKLKDNGIIKALRKAGAKDGDTIRLLDMDFDFIE